MKGDAVEPNINLQPQFHPSASSQDHEISEEPPINNTMKQDLNPLATFGLDELAPTITFCDRFEACLVSILECVWNCDFV
ncbi:hypothetical protein ACJRO7_015356 [Eucalyptus globulus]|uniref:Uncharacterized protein n=1 Tax=Eucalyptus globulus TaxID=34317 RepID=A0ABD3L720_EUCGL